ncbi:Ig-like domain-containing protein [Heyndrickxia acidicola]|uniref:Ig-like domain-containing protein n=1 Tax=Heyndrickxia acidicola TaxID=209389 RepID=A0ABU6MIN2_9BACI|nr:Ig-like domain-containing protein [Heyndrickxia acidicola]MED1204529.1 Ig-like domain-containing protein [Heyndrickxia acidicola]
MLRKNLIFIFILALSLAGVVPSKADSDTTPLILKTASINQKEFHSGDTIKMEFTVENDNESGPAEDADITLANGSSSKTIYSMMRYTGNNTYEFSYRTDGMLQGNWYVESITLYDNAGNSSTYGSGTPLISNLSFSMLDGETDSTPPELTSVKISQSTAKPGDKVIVSIEYNDESGLSNGSVSFRHIETNDYPSSLFAGFHYNDVTGHYEAEITIPKNVRNGEYDIGDLSLTDKAGNEIRYWYNNQDMLANAKLTISGGITDNSGPVFNSVTVGENKLYPGDLLGVTVNGEDVGSGIKAVQVSFKRENTQNSNDVFWGNLRAGSTNNEWTGQLQVPAYASEGTYYIDQIYLQDQVGNSTFIKPDASLPTVQILPFYTGVNSGLLQRGTDFDPMAGVKALSNAEGDRTKDIVMKGSVDSSSDGIYLLTYSVPSWHFHEMNSNTGTYYYNAYRWITVNDQQPADQDFDTTYFNESVKIGVPSNSTVSLSDGKTLKNLSSATTVTTDGSYQVSTSTNTSNVRMASVNNFLAMNQKSAFSPVATKKTIKFVIDKQKPAAPVLSPIYSESVTISGKTEAYSKVKILCNGKFLAAGKTDSKGQFSVRIPKQTAGSTISVQATDRAGNVGSATVKKVLYVPSLQPVSNVSLYVSGKSMPKSTLKIYSNGVYIKTGKADSKGYYKISIPKQSQGKELKVVETTIKGIRYTSLPVKVLDKLPPAPPSINKVTKSSVYVTGHSEKGATVLVYRGKTKIAADKAAATGKFNIAIPKQKAGTILTVYAVDASNNKSKPGYIKVQ